MKQSDTLGGLILIPLTPSVLFLSYSVWNMSSRKKACLVCFLFFCLFVPANLAQHFSGALCCFVFSFLFLFFFPWCSLFHLANDLAHFRVQFRSCFTVHHPSPHRHTHIHTFPQSDTLPSHSKQINSSLSTLGTPEWNAAAHSSPGNCCSLSTRAKGG